MSMIRTEKALFQCFSPEGCLLRNAQVVSDSSLHPYFFFFGSTELVRQGKSILNLHERAEGYRYAVNQNFRNLLGVKVQARKSVA